MTAQPRENRQKGPGGTKIPSVDILFIQDKESEKQVKQKREDHLANLKKQEEAEQAKKQTNKQREEKIAQFFHGLKAPETEDLRDKLDELA